MIKLLVVDDSPMDRALVAGLISKRLDCQIDEAADGREALLRIEADHPDFVLTDLQMPEMNGLELVTWIRERFSHIPVILMTARGSEEIAAQALQRGAACYVPKRRLAEDLVRTIQRVIETSRKERRHSLLMHHIVETETRFELQNDPSLLQLAVSHLLDLLRCMPLGDETERLRVGIALEEALNNAYFHGNLQASAEQGAGERKRYEEIAAERSNLAPYCYRKIQLQVQISPERARFVVRDEGPGFDVQRYLQQNASLSEHSLGRGIVLMRSIMDEVVYNETGNEVTLLKRAPKIDYREED